MPVPPPDDTETSDTPDDTEQTDVTEETEESDETEESEESDTSKETETAPSADTPPSDNDGGLNIGAIIGIVCGSVTVVGIGGFALVWFVIKKKSFADLIAIFKKK